MNHQSLQVFLTLSLCLGPWLCAMLCPKCHWGHHWANQCHSRFTVDDQPINHTQENKAADIAEILTWKRSGKEWTAKTQIKRTRSLITKWQIFYFFISLISSSKQDLIQRRTPMPWKQCPCSNLCGFIKKAQSSLVSYKKDLDLVV
jgi:hypothetical protein